MAINPSATYPGQVDTTDPDYPLGKAQNETVEGDGVGTPLEATWISDLWGFLQALLDHAGIAVVGAGTPDKVGASQYLEALTSADWEWTGDVKLAGSNELSYAPARTFTRRWHLGRGQFDVTALDDRYRANIGTDGALQIVNDASIAAVSVSTWREPLPPLPVGATWTKLEVYCQPNGEGVVGVELKKRTPTTTSTLGSYTDTVSVSVGALLAINFSEVVDADNCYFLEITVNGADAGGPVTAEARYMIFTWSATRASGNY